MAVGITGNNPELVINVTYDTNQSQQNFNKFASKLEQDAAKHESKLEQIKEKGAAQIKVSQDKADAQIEAKWKKHHADMLMIQEKAQARMVSRQTSWSAKMSAGLNSLVTSVKVFAAAYATALVGSAIKTGLENIDEISKTARDLGLSFEYLQSKIIQFSLSGLSSEQTLKLLQELDFVLKEKTGKAYEDLLKAGIETTNGLEVAWEQLVDYAKNNPNDAIVYEKRRYANFVRAVNASTDDLLRAQEILRKFGFSEKEIKSIEKFNDGMTLLGATLQLIVGKIYASFTDELSNGLKSLVDGLVKIDWASVGRSILFMVQVLEKLGKVLLYFPSTMVAFYASFKGITRVVEVFKGLDIIAGRFANLITPLGVAFKELGDMKIQVNSASLEEVERAAKVTGKTFEEMSEIMHRSSIALSKDSEILVEGMNNYSKAAGEAGKAFLEGNKIGKIAGFFGKLSLSIKDVWTALKTTEGVLGFVFRAFGKIGSIVAYMLKPLGAVFKILGKWSGVLTILFAVFDVIDGMNNGLSFTQALFYAIIKLFTDFIDGIVYIFTLGKIDLGLTDVLKDLFGVKTELKEIKEHYDNLKSSIGGLSSEGAKHLDIIANFLKSIGYSSDRVVKIFAKFQPFSNSVEDVKQFLVYLGYSSDALENLVKKYSIFLQKNKPDNETDNKLIGDKSTTAVDNIRKTFTQLQVDIKLFKDAISKEQNPVLLLAFKNALTDLEEQLKNFGLNTESIAYLENQYKSQENLIKQYEEQIPLIEDIISEQEAAGQSTTFWTSALEKQKKAVEDFYGVHKTLLDLTKQEIEENEKRLTLLNKEIPAIEKEIAIYKSLGKSTLELEAALKKYNEERDKLKFGESLEGQIKKQVDELQGAKDQLIEAYNLLFSESEEDSLLSGEELKLQIDALLVKIGELEEKIRKGIRGEILTAEELLSDAIEEENRKFGNIVNLEVAIKLAIDRGESQEVIDNLKKKLSDAVGDVDFSKWYETWNEVISKTADFVNQTFTSISDLFNITAENYQIELDYIRELMTLENERWAAQDARMEESGIKNTAYYLMLQKQHLAYIKEQEKLEKEKEAQITDVKREGFEWERAGKISQTIMNTAQAIMAAWAANTLLAPILTPIIGAIGALQIGTIAAQKNPYVKRNSGGWIPGFGPDKDAVPAMLTPGEFVVNRTAARENASLLEMVNAGKNTGQQISNNVYVNIDGNLVGNSEWVENDLIPEINRAINKGHTVGVN